MNQVRKQFRPDGKIFWQFLGIAFLAFTLTGCGLMRFNSSPPKPQVSSIQLTNSTSGPVTFPVLQQQVMRLADTYAATVAQACDEISATTTNAELRLTMLRWK